jgi:hypothetical protein
MAIGDNDDSDEDHLTDISGVSEPNSDSDSDQDGDYDLQNIQWVDEMPDDGEYAHLPFTGPARQPQRTCNAFNCT